MAICDSQTQWLSDTANGTATLIVKSSMSSWSKSALKGGEWAGKRQEKCRNAFDYDYGFIKTDVIGQATACNPEEQEEGVHGMTLNFHTFMH